MEQGAKLFIENKDGKTACDLSEDGQFTAIAAYLESKMVFSVSGYIILLKAMYDRHCFAGQKSFKL